MGSSFTTFVRVVSNNFTCSLYRRYKRCIIGFIREEALKALAMPAVRDRLMAVGLNVNTQNPPTPEQMAQSLKDDYESVGAMLRSVNYKPE